MKRKILTILLALLVCAGLCMTVSAYSGEQLIYDGADLLTTVEESRLYEQLASVSGTYDSQIIVATLPSMQDGDIDEFVEYLYDRMELGYGTDRSGVLLLVCMDPREYRILSNGRAADAITPGRIDSIGSAIVPDLSGGDYADAFETFADRCAYYLEGELVGFPFPVLQNLLIALAVGLTAGLITVLIMRSQLKSVHRKVEANSYVRRNSLNLTLSRDIFLYRNVSRTRRETESSSRSGSSRNIGGGSF